MLHRRHLLPPALCLWVTMTPRSPPLGPSAAAGRVSGLGPGYFLDAAAAGLWNSTTLTPASCIAADLFDILLPMLNIYQEFVRNHQYSLQILAHCKQNRDFDKLLKHYEAKPDCEERTLETFLTYPMFQVHGHAGGVGREVTVACRPPTHRPCLSEGHWGLAGQGPSPSLRSPPLSVLPLRFQLIAPLPPVPSLHLTARHHLL